MQRVQMKRLIVKTIIATIGIVLILGVAAFGIISLCAPATMMDFTDSLGLSSISGDYAYREYERSGSLSCLARSFLISADLKKNGQADEKFTLLYGDERFSEFCAEEDERNSTLLEGMNISGYNTRSYLCGIAACVKYRLARSDSKYGEEEVADFAIGETGKDFGQGNPVILLTVEAARAEDGGFCSLLLRKLETSDFEENDDYSHIVTILEEHAHE